MNAHTSWYPPGKVTASGFLFFFMPWIGAILSAQEFKIPNKEIIIYLDNSSSIVRNEENPPSKRLADMLTECFSPAAGFLNENDVISIQTFGAGFSPEFSRSSMVGKDPAWQVLFRKFGQPRDGDLYTNFSTVFNDISRRVAQPAQEERLRVFIIASDFNQDPENEIKSRNLPNATAARKMQDRLWEQMEAAIQSLSDQAKGAFIGESPKNFLLCLKTQPFSLPTSNSHYLTLTQNLSLIATNTLANQLNATILEYQPGSITGKQFAQSITRLLTQWLEVSFDSIRNTGKTIRLQINNPNSFPIKLTGVGIAFDRTRAPTELPIKVTEIVPGNRNLVDIDISALGRTAEQENLYFYPRQDPEPPGLRKASAADGLSWGSVEVEKVKVVRLLGHRQTVLITVWLHSFNEIPERSKIKLDFDLITLATGTHESEGPAFAIKQNIPLILKKGEGQLVTELMIRHPEFDFENLEQYQLRVTKKSETGSTELQTLTALDVSWTLPTARLPGPATILAMLFLMIIFFFVSIKTVPSLMVAGFRDPLFRLQVPALLVLLAGFWFLSPRIPHWYPSFFGAFPAFSLALLLFRFFLRKADEIIDKHPDPDNLVVQEEEYRFLRFRLVICLIFFLATWYASATFLF